MGTGSSKSKAKGNVVVAANVTMPGYSKPMKVKAQLNLKDAETGGGSGQLSGPATLKQVAPNKFSVQMGSQKLGTFDVPSADGDFAAHLANAAQMTVTNIEMVSQDSNSEAEVIDQPMQILLHQETPTNYSEDEDWEDVIQDLNAKENKPTLSENAKERKARLKQTLLQKQAQLSQQEYEQMIANHKQEVELMALLREKERERQKFTLQSKVAQRQQRRQERKAQRKEREKVAQQVNRDAPIDAVTDGNKDSAEHLEQQMQHREATFQRDVERRRDQLTEAEYQRLLDQHRAEMEGLRRSLEHSTDSQKQNLEDKLAERRRRKKAGKGDVAEPEMTAQDVCQLEADLKRRQAQLEAELREQKDLLSEADIKKLIGAHKEELGRLQQELDLQRDRQRQSLLDKLEARRVGKNRKDSAEASQPMSADEVRDVQLALSQKAMDFRGKLKEAKASSQSQDHTKEMMDRHRKEMELLQGQLDKEKERMRQALLDKLDARRRKAAQGAGDEELPPLTAEELKQLQVTFDRQEAQFKEDMRAKKGRLSEAEYQRLMEQHRSERDQLASFLAREKERMEQRLRDKMEARRFRIPTAKERVAAKTEEVAKLEQEIQQREATFAREVEGRRSGLSEAEYQQLLAQHQRDVERLKGRLALALERQQRNFADKLSERQRRKAQLNAEEEERRRLLAKLEDVSTGDSQGKLETLQEDIAHYDKEVRSSLLASKGQVSEAKFRQMLEDHQKNVDILQGRLDRERERMQKVLEAKMAARSSKGKGSLSSHGHDMGESDIEVDCIEEVDVIDFAKVVDVSTQLWTTPTQSTSLVVVPLKEEYPVKKKRQLYTNPDIFRTLDAHAIKLAQTVSLVTQPTFSSLVNELVSRGSTELEKVRLVCRWLTAQNCQEMDLNEVIDDTPLGVLKGLYHQKITFSTLFMRMCRFAGLRCVEINGCAKKRGYNPGQPIGPKDQRFQHTWNAVCIDGYWHFVDCNWGVSHIQGSVELDPFRFEYDEHYFLADPDVIIRSHFPTDPLWQLLERPVALQEFNAWAPLKPDFFKFGLELLSHTSAAISSINGELDIRVGCPQGVILATRLSTVEGGLEFSKAGVPYDQFDFIHQVAPNVMACYIRIPDPGVYHLTLYAKKQYLDGEINLESETEICRYLVHSDTPCRDQEPLPPAPADHWGPIGVLSVGLTPLDHRTAVIMASSTDDLEVSFACTRLDLSFSHTLTAWDWTEEKLAGYSMQRRYGDRWVFRVAPPGCGRYGLHLFARYPTMPTPVHVCSYLIVCPAGWPPATPFPRLPEGRQWGEAPACRSLGVSTFTHPDPFIVTAEPDLQIVLALSLPVCPQNSLIYYGAQLEAQDISSQLTFDVSGRSVTFLLPLQRPGFYHLSIHAKYSNDIPASPVYSYLIKKT